ncbi:WD40/YVTN/BNR-like repeat-containing protein [Hwangdonia lutea]|uniref:Oxidoreductase n=1 Tax=Hwangdonia lutea TaxID=3075823 RepID=A0AA97EQM2_9FLAO|nr:oxidoreductase [Hwangdonia sp. SCSIO 19198]WOD44303.1 oxidoreductase [Hwangdonia sp. SCSIO 19198]
MKRIVFVLVVMVFFSCKKEDKFKSRNFYKVEIEHIVEDSLLNVRAIELHKKDSIGVFATSNGEFGAFAFDSNKSGLAYQIQYDSIVPNFRSLALTSQAVYVLSISSPSLLYKVTMYTDSINYIENHPKAFYDSMDFWNDNEGIAIGDPTEDCMSIIITRDGGETWTKLSCDDLPKAKDGEAAFAASDTNIAIVGDNTWVATGGKASRVLYSPDKGKTWDVFETPIIQGLETTGIYSIDFYDDLNGFAIGGDYTKPDDNAANKIRTTDGGKTWDLVAQNQNPGYRSCVQYMPSGKGKELVAIGFKGIDYSNDSGNTWKRLSDEGFYTIRFLNDSVAYAAGAGRISKLTFREQ